MRMISREAMQQSGLPVPDEIVFDVEVLATFIADLVNEITNGIEQAQLWRELMELGYKDGEINIAMQLLRYRNQVIYIS
ncbi:MAG: hypothetical protein NAG76_22495 [Candidatus Pristimantibacillus lignocellulolyticus]|uniref:Uncharacterized protein n=1 Tax=Candidatus Pristimantibacillus lignocellulolyticus TaxID=2994561 RepID=A0A9J6ZEH3_9BACL|nr:MAG: hypothetical protein NAG76_22495 [Candidatus Pristimantibacillus lignocellulolyticus]